MSHNDTCDPSGADPATADRIAVDAIELISSSHLKKCVRELKEDPWARVKLMSERITRTPLRLNAGRFSAFDLTPRSMYRLFMERMAANGIREARISEEWNELEGWTLNEIATAQSISQFTVASRVRRARKHFLKSSMSLKKQLKGDHP